MFRWNRLKNDRAERREELFRYRCTMDEMNQDGDEQHLIPSSDGGSKRTLVKRSEKGNGIIEEMNQLYAVLFVPVKGRNTFCGRTSMSVAMRADRTAGCTGSARGSWQSAGVIQYVFTGEAEVCERAGGRGSSTVFSRLCSRWFTEIYLISETCRDVSRNLYGGCLGDVCVHVCVFWGSIAKIWSCKKRLKNPRDWAPRNSLDELLTI